MERARFTDCLRSGDVEFLASFRSKEPNDRTEAYLGKAGLKSGPSRNSNVN